MRVVVASVSEIKLAACRAAFPEAEIVAVPARSGVAAQPVGAETLRGARNRLGNARVIRPDGDMYVSIENGLFVEDGQYVDRALVLVGDRAGREGLGKSDGVAFPESAVTAARARGFQYCTVGQVMQERGLVEAADDPHLDLSGQPRRVYLAQALTAALAQYKAGPGAPVIKPSR
jgi:non-canonical (house-cleaning) NTP pyrophosphatase